MTYWNLIIGDEIEKQNHKKDSYEKGKLLWE